MRLAASQLGRKLLALRIVPQKHLCQQHAQHKKVTVVNFGCSPGQEQHRHREETAFFCSCGASMKIPCSGAQLHLFGATGKGFG